MNQKSLKNGLKTAETRVSLKNFIYPVSDFHRKECGTILQYPVLLTHLWLYGATIFASQCNVRKGVSML